MKTKSKKLLLHALTAALTIAILIAPMSFVSNAAMPFSSVSYTDTFDDATLPNWESYNNSNLTLLKACVADGKLNGSNNTAQVYGQIKTSAFDFGTYTDYTVECTATLGETGVAPDALKTTGIFVRGTTANTGGYEFQLYLPKDSTTGHVRLYERASAAARIIATETNGTIVENSDATFSAGAENSLKVTVTGNLIECYLNGVKVISYTDTLNAYPTGSAGIRMPSTSYAQVFDNFSVSHVSVLENKFYDEFNYDQANNALKKSALNNKGWYCQNNASAGYFTDGALNIPADCNAAQVGYQTQGARGALGWNDYSVEADVTFAAGELTNAVYAGVSGRHNDVVGVSPSGYEIALFIKTDGTSGMRIYARGGAGELASCDLAIARGTAYNVKVIFQGNTIYAYLDGALKLTVTDSTYPIGFAGIRYIGNAAGVGIVTTIDNFVVYDYDEAPPATPAKYEDFESYTPSYLDDGVTYDKSYIQTAGWGSVSNASLVNYVPYFDNGVLTVPTQHSTTEDYNLVMVNNTKMKNLENYSVSYDVKALTNTATATYLYLSGRDTDYKNGYFARLWMQAGVIRGVALYKNVNGTRTMFGTQYAYAAGSRFNVLEQFTVKISFSGDTIEVYVNSDTPVVTVTDDTYTKGTIGVHAFTKSTALGSACEVDNITVYDYDNSAVYTKEIVGDVNLDSTVNSDDVSAIIGNMLNDVGEPDLNKDGSFDIADVVRLKRIIVSL